MSFYLSSTYEDLKEHREAAISAFADFAIRSADIYDIFDPNTLFQTGASDLDVILHNVRESSYFVLILGWRYGYIPQVSEKSIVELEYETAVKHGIPRSVFLIDDRYPVPPRHVETGEGAGKLLRFKARVQEEHFVRRFTTPADLARELTLAVSVLDRPLSEATQALVEHSALTEEYHRYRSEAELLRESVDFYRDKLERVVPVDPIWRGRKFRVDSTLCFVLMPFSDQFFFQYEEAIVPALESAGLRSVHAGEIFGTREIMEDIWELICTCKLLIADVTGRNANVFYELGIAHTLGKQCVVLTQNSEDVPFDISARRYLRYEPSKLVSLRTRLAETVKNILTRNAGSQ